MPGMMWRSVVISLAKQLGIRIPMLSSSGRVGVWFGLSIGNSN